MHKDIYYILNKLNENKHEAFLVGGYVRDHILNKQSKDIDITTSALPSEVKDLFEITIDTGIKYGTVTVIYNDIIAEVTTYRTEDMYEQHRKPKNVNFNTTIEHDVHRRDFTMNSILMDKDCNIIDYLGGINDINNKLIRSINDASLRIEEDALRILRAFKFKSRLDFTIDKDLSTAIKNNTNLLKSISSERIYNELREIFDSSYCVQSVEEMINLGVFDNIKGFYNIEKYYKLFDRLNLIEIKTLILDDLNVYNFSKSMKKNIRTIRDRLNKDLDKYTIYTLDNELLMSIIRLNKLVYNKDTDYLLIKESFPIKNNKDINVDNSIIANKVSDKSLIGKILVDIKINILNNKLINKEEDIIKHVDKNLKNKVY